MYCNDDYCAYINKKYCTLYDGKKKGAPYRLWSAVCCIFVFYVENRDTVWWMAYNYYDDCLLFKTINFILFYLVIVWHLYSIITQSEYTFT